MKSLLMCTPVLIALTFAGCATVPKQPKTFDQLGQFTAYPLNNKFVIKIAKLNQLTRWQ